MHKAKDNKDFLAKRCLAILIVLVCIILFICNVIVPETKSYKYDFAAYYTTWYAAKHGLDLYDPVFGHQGGDSPHLSSIAKQAEVPGKVPFFLYSPAFAVTGLLMPPVSYRTAELIVVWGNGLIWLLCVGCLVFILVRNNDLARAGIFMLATVFPPADFTIRIGQPNIFVFLLIVITLWALIKRHNCLAGVMIALGMLAKTHLGLFLVYFIVRRRWTAIASSLSIWVVLILFSLVTLGTKQWDIYLNNVLPAAANGWAYIANQSVAGFLARFVITDPNLLFSRP